MRDVRAKQTADKTALSAQVVDVLSNLAAAPAFAVVQANTGMGFTADAMVLLQSGTTKPAPVTDLDLLDDSPPPKGTEK